MDDLAQIESEEVVNAPELDETPAAPLSIREELGNALAKSKEPKEETEKEVKVKPDRARSDDGKFVPEKNVSRETKGKPVASAVGPLEVSQEIKMPKSYKPEMQADWAKLPRPVQEQLSKRDEDYHKELTKHDEERVFGRQLKDIANPYLPIILADGGDVKTAFQRFLNTAYRLRTLDPQSKGQLILQLAQEFKADLRGASQAQPQINPQLQGLQQQLLSLQQKIDNESALKKQQEDNAIQSQIKTFSDDPKNVHFEAVKAHMASLLKSGLAKDLQDAYDQAVYANPQTRSTLLQQNVKTAEEQRVADKKAKAEAAKKAGSSLRGSPGIAATKNGKITQPDLRSEIRAAFASHAE